MRKRNKLYTANKWNQPLFMGDNFFDEGGDLAWDRAASQAYGADYGESGKTLEDYQNSTNAFGLSKVDNPFSKGNLASTFSSSGVGGMLKGGAIGALGSAVGSIGNKLISGGLDSGAGKAVAGIGSAVGGLVGKVNPVMGAAVSAASGIIGGGINALFGTKTDYKKLNAANAGTNYLQSFKSNATSFDDIKGPNAVTNVQDAYKGGVFKKGWAAKKNAELKAQRAAAESYAYRSVDNNVHNIASTQMDNLLANYSAFGGPLGAPNDGGAIDYGFMSDYLTMRNRAAEAKNKISTNVFGNLPVTPLSTFALGGDIQTNGADFTDGLSVIGAGGSHEENPYQGVQVGISRENGQPNLVEEGETIFDDYVYSKRIKADKETKKKFHIGKNASISFADLSKRLEKESLERPNDPLSQAALRKQMHELAEEQERQKSEKQAKEAEDAFSMLPPEQQQAILQQVAMEEQQAAQQSQGEEQPNGQPQVDEGQQEVPQEPQQQVDENMQGQMNPQMIGDNGEQINACGGRMNRFDDGGNMKRAFYKLLSPYVNGGIHTDADFDKWLYNQKLDRITDWKNILKNKPFMDAVSAQNPALGDVISRGYDFGNYKAPVSNDFTADFKHGAWGLEDYNAWNGSKDAAWREAVKKGLVKEGMNSEEIGKALSQTDAYKRGTEWLKADEKNRLSYLQKVFNSEDAPQAARDYAGRFVDKNGWLKDAKRDYQTIFEDPNGIGVRNTHPGTFWKTPDEVSRSTKSLNLEVDDKGNIHEIYGDVPKDWVSKGSYSWQDKDADNTVNYFARPAEGTATEQKTNNGKIVPVHKPTWGRYAGLFGPAVGLGMQAMGIGKPDYSGMDASIDIANGSPAFAEYKPIGDYIGYKPMDIWFEQNRMNANSRATDRAILNNASPEGTKMAGLIANGYNSQIASGELYRKALEYNDAQRQRVAEFNRGTNQFNADAFNRTSATNAEITNNNRRFRAQMAMDAARQRMASDAAWNQGIYGNVQGLFKGLSDWGKENEQHNMIARMAADGVFNVITPDTYTGQGYVTTKKAKGGRINRRKGLTF